MQNTNDAYFCTEMLRVVGKLKERLGNRAKKKIIHDLPVHGDEGIQFRRNGENHMEILKGKKIFVTGLDPSFLGQDLAFRTVTVPAGVIRYLQMAAVVALVLVTAQSGSSTEFDGTHGP